MNLITKFRLLCRPSGNRTCALNLFLPLFLLPLLLYFATRSFPIAIFIVFFVIPAFLCHMQLFFKFGLSKTNFFFVWSIISLLYIFTCFEFLVVPLMIISPSENIIFYVLFTSIVLCVQKIKKNAPQSAPRVNCIYCKNNRECEKVYLPKHEAGPLYSENTRDEIVVCNSCYTTAFHRNIWMDCSVGFTNNNIYFFMLLLLFIWLMYTSYLILTTFCQSHLIFNSILVPSDCSLAYETSRSAICIVGVMYSIEIAAFIMVIFVRETLYKLRHGRYRTIIN